MQNLNKYTKHELISKLKTLGNQNSKLNKNQTNNITLIKLVEYLLMFKGLILKLTLIVYIIKWIKKYTLIKKLWHIFNIIASGLLGISLIDIYSLDIITWIKETWLYKWYFELLYPKEIIKDNKSNEFQFPKRITDKTTENETGHTSISEWINRNTEKKIEETKESSIIDTIQKNSKAIIIISGIIIVTGLSYYYFDEIKDASVTSIEWIKNHFSRPSAGSGTNNSTSDISPTIQSSKENWQTRFWRIISRDNESTSSNETGHTGADSIQVINNQTSDSSGSVVKVIEIDKSSEGASTELTLRSTDESRSFPITDKGKGVLTSPSLEDLNNKAQDSWSDDSSSTITPDNFNKTEEITEQVISKIWKLGVPTNTNNNINYIEAVFSSDKEIDTTRANLLIKKLVDTVAEYDGQVELINSEYVQTWTIEEKIKFTHKLYHFRKWISKYHQLIMPTSEILEVGEIDDKPELLIPFFKNKS